MSLKKKVVVTLCAFCYWYNKFFKLFFSSKCRQNKFKTINFLHISYTLAYYCRKILFST